MKILILLLTTLLLSGCNRNTVEEPVKEFTPEPLVIETNNDYPIANVEIFDADNNIIFEVVGKVAISGDDIRVFTDIDDLRMYVEEDN